jgi:superfamily II DNA or RNA helicase
MEKLIKKSYLTKRGYVIQKSKFKEEELEKIRNDLTVSPFVPKEFQINEEKIKIFMENEKKLYLPIQWAIKNLGKAVENRIPDGHDINIKFNGELRKNQIKPVDESLKTLKNKGGGILCLSCGAGKTAIALYLITKLKKKTLIVVHKEFLIQQWIERIKQFLPDADIGLIQGSVIDFKNKDIVVGMIQSLSTKNYSISQFDSFGMCIFDECHRVPCKVFSKVLFKINSKYMLGLSATPNRNDGLIKILKWHIGDIFYTNKKVNAQKEVIVERLLYKNPDLEYSDIALTFKLSVNRSKMINNICSFKPKNNIIIKHILENFNIGRKMLVLSSRLDQLKFIDKELRSQNTNILVGFYIGGMKDYQLKASEECDVILGSYPMAEEGMDIPTLNTIYLIAPKTNVEQSIGRILRKKHELQKPLIVDFVDDFSVFQNQAKKRLEYYKKKCYTVISKELDIDGNIINENSIDYKIENEKEKIKKKDEKKKKEIENPLDLFTKEDY